MQNVLAVTIAVALFFASSAHAVVSPQLAKDNAPIAIKCEVLDVSVERLDEITNVDARCRVLDVVRSAIEMRTGSVVTIRYLVSNDQDKDVEIPKTPGAAPELDPPVLRPGQMVVAYLKPAKNSAGEVYLVPSIGFFSFEIAASRAHDVPEDPTPEQRCLESGHGASTMANAKSCARDHFAAAEQELATKFAELRDALRNDLANARESGDSAMDAPLTGQLQSLEESQVRWEEYRSLTCRYAYYQYFPGSMAGLEELTCLHGLTEGRIEQLEAISTLHGETIDYR
jgi:uncharacterized protein YecT (DUF1311 family)